MLSLSNSKLSISTHGKILLQELIDPSTARINVITDCIRKDPLSGRLKDEYGNNAYHLLLSSSFQKDDILLVLSLLLEHCPEGIRTKNSHGSLPLHLCFCQHKLHEEVIIKALDAFQQAASIKDDNGLIPLFLCVMREDSTSQLCKLLCKIFPEGPSTMNRTHSYPLHFAAKRIHPNIETIRILVKRNPNAACQVNDFGLLPLHCICAMSNCLEATKLIYQSNPDAVQKVDRQGHTCLHLAVLRVGKAHTQAILKEVEELKLEAMLIESNSKNEMDYSNNGYNNSDEDEINSSSNISHANYFYDNHSGKSRNVIMFLIHAYPQALCKENNFLATPVDTVLENIVSSKTKKKVVSVYGLYNDPITARILLLEQRYRSKCFNIQYFTNHKYYLLNLKSKYLLALCDFNWMIRKYILYVSLVGDMNYCVICSNTTGKTYYTLKYNKFNSSTGKNNKNKTNERKINPSITKIIEETNLLARLRMQGFEVVVRYVISYI